MENEDLEFNKDLEAPEIEDDEDAGSDTSENANIAKLQEEKENYRKGMLSTKYKLKETSKKLEELAREVEEIKKGKTKETVESIVDSVASTPEEKTLILAEFEKRFRVEGKTREEIADDINFAKRAITASKTKAEKDELAAKMRSKSSLDSYSTSAQKEEADEENLTEADKAFLQKFRKSNNL